MSSTPSILSPEEYLLGQLSPQWQTRFKKAIVYIFENLDESLTVEKLADVCAVSPFHFHRMFTVALGEPLGSYIRRARLLGAVSALFETDDPITEIAMDCGFSSSQALAKAFKKKLNVSPSQVRSYRAARAYENLMDVYKALGLKLRNENEVFEHQLSDNIAFAVENHPSRYFRCRAVNPPKLTTLFDTWRKMGSEGPMFMINDQDPETVPYDELTTLVAAQADNAEPDSRCMEAGDYLTARVKISSELGYYEAWMALERHMLTNDIEPDRNAGIMEIVHNPDDYVASMDITLCVRLAS